MRAWTTASRGVSPYAAHPVPPGARAGASPRGAVRVTPPCGFPQRGSLRDIPYATSVSRPAGRLTPPPAQHEWGRMFAGAAPPPVPLAKCRSTWTPRRDDPRSRLDAREYPGPRLTTRMGQAGYRPPRSMRRSFPGGVGMCAPRSRALPCRIWYPPLPRGIDDNVCVYRNCPCPAPVPPLPWRDAPGGLGPRTRLRVRPIALARVETVGPRLHAHVCPSAGRRLDRCG
jgi:hypothetical protein